MTRAEHLVFCKKCLHRKMDHKQGYICSLTGQIANFENICSDFKVDETVKVAPLDDKEQLEISEVKQKLPSEILDKLKMEQHLLTGVLSGLIVGIIGAILWGVITVTINYQIGYMALAIGAGVGFTIRKFGKGIDPVFGIWGAGISLFSVLFGNFLSVIAFVASYQHLDFFYTLFHFNYSYLPKVMAETFKPIDLVFYGIAIYEGYKFSFRVITEKALHELKSNS